jgi:AcrR family transcriptional regulator
MSQRAPTPRGQLVLDEIVDAAAAVFAAKGFAKATLENVAERLRVSRATLYYYVRSKDDLLRRVIGDFVGGRQKELEELRRRRDLAPEDRLRHALRSQLRHFDTHPDMARVFLREELELPPDLYAQQRAYRRNIQEAVEQLIEEGVSTGHFRDVDPRLVAFALFGMTNWLHVWYDPEGRYSTDEIADVFADLLLLGIVRREGSDTAGSVEFTISEIASLLDRLSEQVVQIRGTRRRTGPRDDIGKAS